MEDASEAADMRQGMLKARDKKDKKQQRENRRKANRGRGQETKQRPRIGEPRRSFISIHTQPPIARPLAAPYVNNNDNNKQIGGTSMENQPKTVIPTVASNKTSIFTFVSLSGPLRGDFGLQPGSVNLAFF